MSAGYPQRVANPLTADEGAWIRDTMRLRFVFGGVAIFAAHLPALILDAPFNQVTSDPSQPPAPPEEFPEGIEATRIFSCPLQARPPTIALLPRAIRYIPNRYDHLYVRIEGSFEQYLHKFSSKTRWTFRKKLKRFMDGVGTDAFRHYCDVGQMQEFCTLSRAISEKTYQQRLLDAGIPQTKDFPGELERLAVSGRVRGYILLHGNVPTAYALCYVHRDTLTLDKMGFDPEYAHLHPGTVLTYLMIERLLGEHEFRILDFGSGHFEYKALFSTDSVRCADIIYLRRTLHNLILVLAHRGLDTVSETLKELLDVLGLRARIRKLIHHNLLALQRTHDTHAEREARLR
jgi:CelD/BcsL family acetyltransferase involved in cellulose biosynthesis